MTDLPHKSTTSNSLLGPPQTVPLPRASAGLQLPTTMPQKLNSKSGSSGSATGNPRNKCALKPGYSLMSWIRLCNSGADLSGTNGRVVPVTRSELAQHNKVTDAWMAIRGRVFNVTRYMEFHPGGVDELLRGVGRDATALFDEVHAWVNYPQLLGKCYIGPLKENAPGPLTAADPLTIDTRDSKPVEIVPRFDWIQQRSELTLFFYTRSFTNPGLFVRRKDSQQLVARVLLENSGHTFDFQLAGKVEWPPKAVRVGAETGKIELVLAKEEPSPWTSYGTHTSRKLDSLDIQEETYEYEVLEANDFNQDSFELSLQSVQKEILMVLPVGHHLNIQVPVDGDVIQRSYTPVDHNYLQTETNSLASSVCLHFLIKRYTNGPVSSYLHRLQPGSRVHLSSPRGGFMLSELTANRNILLLAAGSGLTPILSLIPHLLKRNTNRIESLHLFYFNKTEADIWLREKLQNLQAQDERFNCTHILSQAEEQPQRISSELLAPLFKEKQPDRCTYAAICGPSPFNTAAVDVLKSLNVMPNQMHVFRG
ncbi:cytochrome b5 reductase 4 [Drosophila subobscura]|uniref:cytochrome b5 reductase 4 n=1 Tax=Drosophila subobscura TaxID=7241 RepID=UPI00155AF1C0|nr:cytochrome b5 reductase 4 [Drosophila subobscura]